MEDPLKWCTNSLSQWYVDKNGNWIPEYYDGDWTGVTVVPPLNNQKDCQNMCEKIPTCIGITFGVNVCMTCFTDDLNDGSDFFYRRPGNLISALHKRGSNFENKINRFAGFYFQSLCLQFIGCSTDKDCASGMLCEKAEAGNKCVPGNLVYYISNLLI